MPPASGRAVAPAVAAPAVVAPAVVAPAVAVPAGFLAVVCAAVVCAAVVSAAAVSAAAVVLGDAALLRRLGAGAGLGRLAPLGVLLLHRRAALLGPFALGRLPHLAGGALRVALLVLALPAGALGLVVERLPRLREVI